MSDTILIDATTQNGSFETETGKIQDWAGVSFWHQWDAAAGGPATASGDSGADGSGAATDGSRVAFLQFNNAAYNGTSYSAQVGDEITYLWDWVLPGRGIARVHLVYESAPGVWTAIAGTDTVNPDNVSVHTDLGTSYTVTNVDGIAGKNIGLGIVVNEDGGWPEVDNFRLSVAEVPEPGSLALVGLGGLLAIRRRRR